MAEPKYKIMGNMIWFMESSEPPRQVTPIERELLSELAGVRGLLQRALNKIANAGHDLLALEGECPKAVLIALELTEVLVPSGAESADIGKLDAAPEKAMKAIYALREEMLNYSPSGAKSGVEMGKVNRVDEMCDEFRGDDPKACSTCGRPVQGHGSIVLPTERMTKEEFKKRYPGNAETGGEKA